MLRGKTAVFVDWANVYGWTKSLKTEVDPVRLHKYLKSYDLISAIHLYAGEDTHHKSKEFLREVAQIGYRVVSKPVKYITVEVDGKKAYRRKCDFDMEVCIDAHFFLQGDFESFVFFSGDGDFEPLYKLLIGKGKQVIVIYTAGHLGREIWNIERGLFKAQIKNLMDI